MLCTATGLLSPMITEPILTGRVGLRVISTGLGLSWRQFVATSSVPLALPVPSRLALAEPVAHRNVLKRLILY
ncbi:MAG: hypothetical protein KDB05_13125, partial [Planctomycetales bacterium]|nr:hypothetical protein [Planctomycetales bacterium]